MPSIGLVSDEIGSRIGKLCGDICEWKQKVFCTKLMAACSN